MSTREDDSLVNVTQLLKAVGRGDRPAFDQLLPLVYEELKRVAHGQMRREREGHTLDTTGLVHEAYLKLVDQSQAEWQDRAHFYGVAARAMRQILIDYARRRAAQKRGGGWEPTTADDDVLVAHVPYEELIALDDVLERLDQLDARLRQVVESRAPLPPARRLWRESVRAELVTEMGQTGFEDEWSAGRLTDFEDVPALGFEIASGA